VIIEKHKDQDKEVFVKLDIRGKDGDLYEYGTHDDGVDMFAVSYFDGKLTADQFGGMHQRVPYSSPRTGRAMIRLRKCQAAGMEVIQQGDSEFTALFNPSNTEQTATAMSVAGIKSRRIRVLTPEQKERQIAVLTAARVAKRSALQLAA
jgi:hypothetical protein